MKSFALLAFVHAVAVSAQNTASPTMNDTLALLSAQIPGARGCSDTSAIGRVYHLNDWGPVRTGNQYLGARDLLERAICCAGVAQLPTSLTHLPASDVTCFDFSSLARDGDDKACRSRTGRLDEFLRVGEPPLCGARAALQARRAAAIYSGFGHKGLVWGRACPSRAAAELVVHLRSGDIFSGFLNGTRPKPPSFEGTAMFQPPLSWYASLLAHRPPSAARGFNRVRVVAQAGRIERANPVLPVFSVLAKSLRLPVTVQTSSFEHDLSTLLCAHSLALAQSSLTHMFYDSPNAVELYRYFEAPQDVCELTTPVCRTFHDDRASRAPPSMRCCPGIESTRVWCSSLPAGHPHLVTHRAFEPAYKLRLVEEEASTALVLQTLSRDECGYQ